MKHQSARCLVVLGSVILVGCQTPPPPDTTFVAKQWSDSIQTLNISAVYPPTEDLQVGDVFIGLDGAPYEKGSDYLARSAFLGRVDVTDKLNAQYGSRLVLPKTPNPPDQGKFWTQLGADNKNVFKPPAVIDRLPLVAFPGFTVVKVRSAELKASVPVQAFQALFGASYSGEASVAISIPAAETYGIGIYDAAQALVGWCMASNAGICGQESLEFFSRNFSRLPHGSYQPRLYFINRVYYARSITYKYSSKAVAAFRASAAQAASSQNAGSGSVPQSSCPSAGSQPDAGSNGAAPRNTPAKDTGGGTTAPASNPATEATAAINAAQQNLAQSGLVSSMPGVSLAVSSLDGESIELTQTFEHPVAIGYRAYRSEPIEPAVGN